VLSLKGTADVNHVNGDVRVSLVTDFLVRLTKPHSDFSGGLVSICFLVSYRDALQSLAKGLVLR
jgi:hypothetical protein